MELKNKVVVVTGGGNGFGKALAKAFADELAIVVIAGLDGEKLKETSLEIGCESLVADVTKFSEVEKLGEGVVRKWGHIGIWINNAGVQIAPSLVESVDRDKLRQLFDVNFFGYFYGCQVALQWMKPRGEGVIININSTAGMDGKPELSAYSASKFAVKGLTESLRKENANTGVKVYGVFPGGMQTDIYKEKVPSDIAEYMQVEPVAKKVIENLKQEKPEEDLVIKRPAT